jgi:hypothetical protein
MASFYDPIELKELTPNDFNLIKDIENEFRKLPAWRTFDSHSMIENNIGVRINFFKPPLKDSGTITKFIKLVKAEEAKYELNQQSTIDMLTAIRKIFYDTPGWDKYLIKGAKEIPSPYGHGKCIGTLGPKVSIPHLPLFFYMVETVCYPEDPHTKLPPDILSLQEIAVPSHTTNENWSDIAHTLCGLDASNYPDSVKLPVGRSRLDSNIHAVTWLGDLGSVLAEALIILTNDMKPFSPEVLQDAIDKFAGPADMLGNIEPYNIHTIFHKHIKDSTMKVSDILTEYYLGERAEPFQKRRFQQFAEQLGAQLDHVNKKIIDRSRLQRYLSEQIGIAGAMYIMANADKSPENIPVVVGFATAVTNHGASELLSEALLQAIEKELF